MRVSTLLLLQIVSRRLGRRAKSYFIIIIVDDDEKKRGKKSCKIVFLTFLFTFLMNDNERISKEEDVNRKRGF